MIGLSTSTKAVLATIEEDHTIKLPVDMPVGRKVAVFLMPLETIDGEGEARHIRFQRAVALLNEAAEKPQPRISREELRALVDEARNAPDN